jgi:hypothetical protein
MSVGVGGCQWVLVGVGVLCAIGFTLFTSTISTTYPYSDSLDLMLDIHSRMMIQRHVHVLAPLPLHFLSSTPSISQFQQISGGTT